MKLTDILREILEDDEASETEDGAVGGNENVVVFDKEGFVVSVFPEQKKLYFAPQYEKSITKKLESTINIFKNRFRNVKVISRENRTFEVIFDTRENFEEVIELLREMSGNG